MSAGNSVSNSSGEPTYGGAGFEPMTFDLDEIVPDAYPGAYGAKILSASAKPTKKKATPMIVLEFKLLSTDDEGEEAQQSLQSTVTDYIVLSPGSRGNRSKRKLTAIRTALGLDSDIIPARLTGYGDLKPFLQAVKGQELTVWISNQDEDGDVRTNVDYEAPKGGQTMSPMGSADDEEEAEEEAPPPPKAKKNAAAATGKTAKR